MEILEFGNGKRRIAIVGSLHGNEKLGKLVIKALSREAKNYRKLRIKGIIANEEAIRANRRFVDVDGNRCFPGRADGNVEERVAHRVLKELKGYTFVIDLHSTHANMPDSIIITKRRAMGLVNKVPLNKVLFMTRAIDKGGALISNVDCGISLEFYRKRNLGDVIKLIRSTLNNFENGTDSRKRKEVYIVRGVLNGRPSSSMKNYKLIRKGTSMLIDGHQHMAKSDFYPVFVGENEYKNVACMMAERRYP